jgi:hypothetical protein
LWQALACLGAAGLLLDWVYYGRLDRTAARRSGASAAAAKIRSVSTPAGGSLPQRLQRKIGLAARGRS